MPLYEYKCEKCGHRFEKIESHSAPAVKKCPKCGKKAERMIGAPAIQFKGTGWYVTDYAGKSPSSGKDGESSTPKSDDKAADKKPAAEKGAEKPAAKSSEKSSKKK